MTAIIVLGQMHGGTSATAGALVRLGLPHAVEPAGEFFEDHALRGQILPIDRAQGLREREELWGPDPWVYKDPEAIDDLWKWAPAVEDFARWVIVFRDPVAVSVSPFEEPTSSDLDDTDVRRIPLLLEAAAKLRPRLLVSYEKMLRFPQKVSAALAAFAGVDDAPGADSFIRPGYRTV